MASAIVTGAANGIGRAVAERLRDDGFAVAGVDVEAFALAGVSSFQADVAELERLEGLVAEVESALGPLGALVNVAGIFLPMTVEELEPAAYHRQLGVMLHGPVFLARAAGLRMARRGEGRIVNVTSIHASHSEASSLAYDAAKAGLEAATRTLAIELAPRGVLVNSVAPGFVRTRMSIVEGRNELESDWFREVYERHGKLPLGRAAEPAEVAAAVSHLVSADNTYVTGARLLVDGGLAATF